MATTENNYTGNGTQTSYTFSFPYIKKEDVRVTLNAIGTTDFTINDNTPTQIDFVTAPGNNVAIRIYRVTDTSTTSTTFFVGSSIRAQDLNTNFEQALYIGQEEENKIQDVAAGNIADGTITTAKIADDAVTAAKLGPDSVTTAKIAPLAVNQNKLAADSVRTDKILDGNVTVPKIESPLSADLTFASSQTYPKIPGESKTGAYTLLVSDAGKHINTNSNVTVPNGVFSVGDVISIYSSNATTNITITGPSVTLRQAGTTNTGDRTLASYGLATILCVAANDFVITGSGLT